MEEREAAGVRKKAEKDLLSEQTKAMIEEVKRKYPRGRLPDLSASQIIKAVLEDLEGGEAEGESDEKKY